MKNIFNIIFSLSVCLAFALGCDAPKTPTATENSKTTAASPVPTQTAQAASPTGYEKLTFNSTSEDVIKAMGAPDAEVNSCPPKAQISNKMMFYKASKMVVFIAYDTPFDCKFEKSKSHYLGTKGLTPERVLHVSKENARALLDAYKFGI